ncbi:MAG: hypothetical protein ACK4SL_01685 [Candidatus Paceibacteria bacterium]
MEKLLITLKNSQESALKQLQMLKREEERLGVRLLAVERFLRQAEANLETVSNEDEESEEASDILANIEAVRYDLSTYLCQLSDRRAHIEQGLKTALDVVASPAFVGYIEEDARLTARDAATAREGYDDLIANLSEITHQRDNDL